MRDTRMRNTVRIAALAAVWLVTGCLSLSREYPEKRYYALEARREGEARSPHPGTLRVRALRFARGFEERMLVFATGEHRFESDFYHEFFFPVHEMISGALTGWLEQTGVFEEVVTTGSLAEADFVLEGAVRRVYGDLREPGAPAAVVSLHVLLLENDAVAPRILLNREYEMRARATAREPGAIVAAMNDALHEAFSEIERDVAEAAASGEP